MTAETRIWRQMRSVAALALAFVAAVLGSAALADDPQGIPDLIRQQEAQVRKAWKPDAFLVNLQLTRDDASEAFGYDFAFRASSDARLYHVTQGPKGATSGVRDYTTNPEAQGILPTRILDLPAAIAAARKAGMKGNLVRAELFQWQATPSQPVIIWRLVPDNDPITEDPNDPNQRNYFIDAFTGATYNPEHPDLQEVNRGEQAMGPAMAAELSDFAKSLQH
jgi:hypothetical protein